MAYFTRVNGDAQPVFALDVQNGPLSPTSNIAANGPVQPAGPKLEFFSLTANATLIAQGGVNGYISNVIQAVQQTATVAMYQVTPSAPTVLNIALYPTGAYTTATLVAAAQTANAAIGIPTANVAGSATFTNV
jgi:hypothetical protein